MHKTTQNLHESAGLAMADLVCPRRSLHPFGVSVHLIEPGIHMTELLTDRRRLEDSARVLWNRLSLEEQQEWGQDYAEKCT